MTEKIKVGKNTYEGAISDVLIRSVEVPGVFARAKYSARNYWLTIESIEDAVQIKKMCATCHEEGRVTRGNGRVFKAMLAAAQQYIESNQENPDCDREDRSQATFDPGECNTSQDNQNSSGAKISASQDRRDWAQKFRESLEVRKALRERDQDITDLSDEVRSLVDQTLAIQSRQIRKLRRAFARFAVAMQSGKTAAAQLNKVLSEFPEIEKLIDQYKAQGGVQK